MSSKTKNRFIDIFEHQQNDIKNIKTFLNKQKELLPYVSRFYHSLGPQKIHLLLILLGSTLTTCLTAAMPWTGKVMIDDILVKNDTSLLWIACAVLFSIAVIQIVIGCWQQYLSECLRGGYALRYKKKMMKHMIRMPLMKLQEMKVGGVLSRIHKDTEDMVGLISTGVLIPYRAVLMGVISFVSLSYLSWKATLATMVLCCILFALAYVLTYKMRPFLRKMMNDRSDLDGHLTETFNGLTVVRSFSKERSESYRYVLPLHALWRKMLLYSKVSASVHGAIEMVGWLFHISAWLIGGYSVIRGEMTLGALITFTSFSHWLFRPAFMILNSLSSMQRSLACAERVFDILDEPLEIENYEEGAKTITLQKGITFSNINFTYPEGKQALSELSFSIPKGKVTALVGPSGAGKSTIVNCLMRFYHEYEGSIQLDGVNVKGMQLQSYRKLFSLVLQDVFLFDGTIRENILYGDPCASEGRLLEVSKIAHCHEFIDDLEDKYNSIIGEKGVRLSGGQKQRVALARAILSNPKVLVLDEATSHLDLESEALIQQALRHVFRDRTVLVIAHRLSTVLDADKILFIENGRKVEEGTHEELMNHHGRYHQLFSKQAEVSYLPEHIG